MSPRIRSRRLLGASWRWLLLVLLVPARAGAGELVLGAASEYNYTSNFFASDDDRDAANSFLLGPTVGVSDENGRFVYDLDFIGAYQVYVDQSGVDAWESRLRGRASYEIDSRTSVRLSQSFRDVSNLRFSRQDIEFADTALDPNQNRYFRNDLSLELIRELTSRLVLNVRGSHNWTDFRQNIDRNDSQAFETATELRYQVADQHDLGFGAGYVNQEFQEALSRLGSTNHSVLTYLIWDWQIADNVVFSANGGPSWIRTDFDDPGSVLQNQFVGGRRDGNLLRANIASCDVDPGIGSPIASNCDLATAPVPAPDLGPRQPFALGPGQRVGEDDVFTAFGGASLRVDLGSWNLQATYSRRQNTTSGGGLVSSLDRFYTECEFAPASSRWSTFVAGSWDRRETLTEATRVDFTVVDGGGGAAQRALAFTREDRSGERQENLTGIAGVRTAFTRNQSATFEFRYRRSESRNQGFDQPAADVYFAVVTFAYTLDPIRF